MNIYRSLIIMLALGITTVTQSETNKSSSSPEMHMQVLTTQTFKVNGMVCAFCAQGVEKNFNKMDEVRSTKVDLDKMQITIVTTTSKGLDKETIENVIKEAGFSYQGSVTEKEPADGQGS